MNFYFWVMNKRWKIDTYVPNRRFNEIVSGSNIADVINEGMCKRGLFGFNWDRGESGSMGEIEVNGDYIGLVVVEGLNERVSLVYSCDVYRKSLGAVRSVLDASGLRRF